MEVLILNIKRFIITFLISTMILTVIMFSVGITILYNSNVGSGEDIEELDRFIPDTRRNIVVFGTDKSGLHADTIMIFSISEKEEQLSLISVPRDTKVKIPGQGTHKITEAMGFGGEKMIVPLVKEVSGIQVHDYVTVNFKAVESIIDALGGVEFDVPQYMYHSDPEQDLLINLAPGKQKLNGDKSLQLLRFRNYPLGDITRSEVQREFIQALFEQKANIGNLDKVGSVYNAINKNIRSSLKYSDILDLATSIAKMESPDFRTFELPYIFTDPYVTIDLEEALPIIQNYFE